MRSDPTAVGSPQYGPGGFTHWQTVSLSRHSFGSVREIVPARNAGMFGRGTIPAMGTVFYHICKASVRFISIQTLRQTVLDRYQTDRRGGFLLACTHLSHLEPLIVSGIVRRQVRWMARIEFYRRWWAAAILNLGGVFPVDRFGNSLPAVRKAERLIAHGECVGMFPEGGVAKGDQSVMRGAPFKQGVCTISIQTRAPVVPVVVLGTQHLTRVTPWLPFRRGQIYCAFGSEVLPPPRSASRRADRSEMSVRLGAEFVRTYHSLLSHSGLRDEDIP